MKLYFERRILVGIFILVAIFVALGVYTYITNQRSLATSKMVSHTNNVLYHVEQIRSSYFRVETELLRYKITGDTSFFSFYKQVVDSTDDHIHKMKALVSDNATQLARVDSLVILGRKKADLIQRTLTSILKPDLREPSAIPSAENRNLMKALDRIVTAMGDEEKRLLALRIESSQSQIIRFNATFFILQTFSGLALAVVLIAIHRNIKKRVIAESSLAKALAEVRDLYDHAPCGYHSLDGDGKFLDVNHTLLTWIGYRREEVIGKLSFVDILGEESRKVFSREFSQFKEKGFANNIEFEIVRKNGTTFPIILNSTAHIDVDGSFTRSRSSSFNYSEQKEAEKKIQQLNHELEAFTYSVSHDLRAPLRSIDGYTRIVQEDYGDKLDVEGNRLLGIIIRNAGRMGKLIDDLLDFSRLGRKEMYLQDVDMNLLVNSVRRELLTKDVEARYTIVQQPLSPAIGDAGLLRQVWINLVSNAIKYSSTQGSPHIEIGAYADGDKNIYFVRDNGVGFDMKYAHKLFGVFQRLHKVEDFEGTGVGLALVHRIITRHGGTLRAEAKVNEGAVFSFSISAGNELSTYE